MGRTYDLIVAGAGPAGLMAAKTAGENGLNVALLERKATACKIMRVDGGALGINEELFGELLTYNERDRRLCFPVHGFSIAYDGPVESVYGFQIFSPGGRRILFGDWDAAAKLGKEVRVGIAVSKEKLLEGLLHEAGQCSVSLFAGTNVTGIEKSGDLVSVETDRETFKAPFVIAADGVNSRIARILGYNRGRKFTGTWRYLGWELEGDIPVDPGSFLFILAQSGTFSLLPTCKAHHYHLGIFTFDMKINLRAAMETFWNDDETFSPWFLKARKVGINNCVVNELSPVQDPFRDNVLLIGDAAWSREFSNMASLCSGWRAAHEVTRALLLKKHDREGIAAYLTWWDTYFYGPHGAVEFPPGELQDFLCADDIDYLVGLVEKPFPATLNFYSLFKQLGNTYGGLLERVQEERPEVMDKLITMRSSFDELWEAQRKQGFVNR